MLHYSSKRVFDVINDCDTVFLYDVPSKEKVILNEYCYANNKNIYFNFEMNDVVMLGAKTAMLDDKPLVSAVVRDLTFEQKVVKRTMDILISIVGLVVCGPLMLICAALIKAEDGGKVFFRQLRATKGGKLFNVYKFRTMSENNSVNRSVTSNDDRITKVGKILRQYRQQVLTPIVLVEKKAMKI